MNGEGNVLERNDARKSKRGVFKPNNRFLSVYGHGVGDPSAVTETSSTGLLGLAQSVGQLEHIIAEHVEVGLCSRQAARQGGQYDDPGTGFFREERRKLLAELDFRDDDGDTVLFDRGDQRLKMQGRRLCTRLNLNRS